MENLLVKYHEDFGRMGSLDGLFVCTEYELEYLKERLVDFGEVLGKHSEVYTDKVYEHCKVISEDPDLISDLQTVSDCTNTICGHNPFDYLDDLDDE